MTRFGRLTRLPHVRPPLSAVIVGTLALGIGSATALYSVIEAVLLRPYPFREQGRLALLWQADVVRNHPFVEVSYLDARDWATRTSAFESIASMSSVNFATTLTGVGDPRQLQVRAVSHPFFEVLGSAPALGRTLTAADHRSGSPRVVIVGHGLWQSLYGGNPNVIGRSVTLDHNVHTIVGVMPRDFRYPDGAEAWAPVEQVVPAEALEQRGVYWMVAIGRLANGISFDEARAVHAIDPAQPVELQTMNETVTTAMGRWRLNARLFGVLALFALLLAAGGTYSVMNYAVSRRTHEIGVRMALGAGRPEIARMVIGDGLRLALLGVIVGTVIAFLATGLLRHLLIGVGPRHPAAFAAATALLAIVAVAACLIPARRAAAVDPMVAMRIE